jgi:hypothetical protein
MRQEKRKNKMKQNEIVNYQEGTGTFVTSVKKYYNEKE